MRARSGEDDFSEDHRFLFSDFSPGNKKKLRKITLFAVIVLSSNPSTFWLI
jgi:hypothetical protein